MTEKKAYKNGQPISKVEDQRMTFFFRTGIVKAEGGYVNGLMEGEWRFYREDGQLWQVGHFKADSKHGDWIRYDRQGNIEYQEVFDTGKKMRKSK